MKFNEALLRINEAVLKKYSNAAFYEAQGFLVEVENENGKTVDGTIDTAQFRVVYNLMEQNKTVIGSFNEVGKVKFEVINEPWLEDIVTTPYVPMTAEDAIDFLVKKYGDNVVGEGPITLRHQLYPGEAEPRYFIGTLADLHTVNVYTGKIDVPAGE